MNIEEMAVFCKRKGFVYQTSEIYGGLAGFFDFGPLGAELKNNIKREWWKTFVQQREDVAGQDGAIIANPKVWEASGHTANFSDLMLTTRKSKTKIRADQFIEEKLEMPADGLSAEEINRLIKENNLKYNGEEFEDLKDFNLMFETNVGPAEGSKAYLRPETAQLIFTNFRLVQENARLKLPFGIAQMGKAFRNEISPRDFLFRCREFEQMEIEYFAHPKKADECPYVDDVKDVQLTVLSAQMQESKAQQTPMSVSAILEEKLMNPWHAYWLATYQEWFVNLGAKKENFRVRQHVATEKSHYAKDTWDLEYSFPFGWKELLGVANRTDYDLQAHAKASKKDMSLFDEDTKEKIVPHVVAEPSLGAERAFLVFMFDALEYDKERENHVLHLSPKLAPYVAGVFPLLGSKPQLTEMARAIYKELSEDFAVFYDKGGTVGRRYARQDEIGTPYCITVDFDSLEKQDVTIRERDSTKQVRVVASKLRAVLADLIAGRKSLDTL